MAGPLEGVRVLDLSWILSGPFCSLVLADLGADVIKIEQPVIGDKARGNGPFIDGYSAYFMGINRGKRSLALDLSASKGRELFIELANRADVVLENFRPGVMARLGLDYETLRQHNPRLVYAAISGFGQTGPYAQRPALDVIVQGMGGMLSVTGDVDGPPVRPGASVGDITASLYTAIGVLAALHERERSGEGQAIDIGMMDCQVAILENALGRYFATGQVPERLGTRHPVASPFQAFETSDGHVVVAIMGGPVDQWPLFCAAIDHPELIDDPRFESGWLRSENYALLEPVFNDAFRRKTTQEWVEEISALNIPCGPVQNIAQVAADPQIAHREMIVQVPHPALGEVRATGNPVKLSRTPSYASTPAPELGEHGAQVLQELLGLTPGQVEELVAAQVVG
jgi:CoA:oxalate CoA-transferase